MITLIGYDGYSSDETAVRYTLQNGKVYKELWGTSRVVSDLAGEIAELKRMAAVSAHYLDGRQWAIMETVRKLESIQHNGK